MDGRRFISADRSTRRLLSFAIVSCTAHIYIRAQAHNVAAVALQCVHRLRFLRVQMSFARLLFQPAPAAALHLASA